MNKAFTLIELIAVLLILLILAALIIPKLTQVSYKRNLMVCSQNLKKLGAAFHQYVLENDGYAPYNPNAGDLQGDTEKGDLMFNTSRKWDFFMSYEVAYKLGPYLGDASHEKFENGTLNVLRCPGNNYKYYGHGGELPDGSGNYVPWDKYWEDNQNRQAPPTWPITHRVSGVKAGDVCSPGYQIMDYQYNMSLGGSISPSLKLGLGPDYYGKDLKHPLHSFDYKLNFILRYPSEAVIFCDINYANVKDPNETNDPKKTNCYVYGYTTENIWKDTVGPTRTCELIHEGKGINAVFADGHVEFLPGTTCYGAVMKSLYDDLLCWGISYPIVKIDREDGSSIEDIPGVHGYRRGIRSMCIEHDEKQMNVEIPIESKCFGSAHDGL